MSIDLQGIPIIDHHCHPFFRPDPALEVDHFLKIFTESDSPEILHHHVPHTLYYRRAMRYLAEFFRCEPTLEDVLEARKQYEEAELLSRLITDAGIEVLLLDTGFPPAAYTPGELASLLPCQVGQILRLEKLAGELLPVTASFAELEQRMLQEVRQFAKAGGMALKSIIAYRSGLGVVAPEPEAVERAFEQLRRTARGEEVRITAKPLLDALLLSVLELNREVGLPVQFHTGFGDRDIDLLQANPLLLKTLFQERQFREFPIILLHAGYPYVREAGYLVNTYPNLYVDVSLSIPLIHGRGVVLFHELLELAPSTKILYASDGHSFPEFHWLGARFVRALLSQVLSEYREAGVLEEREAYQIGEQILWRNAQEVYRVSP
ncbi:MAG: amidohydrolase [Nitrospinota bacterium]|nr:MAG: amidohydrolase [Nitrospinota bacterium]